MEQLLNTAEDIEWLFQTHMGDFPLHQRRTKSFVLKGNEDCPESVELFEMPDPLVTDRPFMQYTF